MSKITKISPQKNSERVNIYIDETFAFGVKKEILLEGNLFVGRQITSSQIDKIKKSDEIKKCLDKAYRYLSYRPRSESEVRKKLLEKYEPGVVDSAITKLKKLHYVDDVAFVDFWLEARGRSRGPALIKYELRQKGISDDIIRNIENPDADSLTENALTLIRSKRRHQNLPKEEVFKKIAPFLARRGYDYEIIKKVINKL